MRENSTSYSPYIQIYLEVDERKIRLADVLYQSATLYEKASIAPNTEATLVISIDGVEDRDDVLLDNGISEEDSIVRFTYTNPSMQNNRGELYR